MVEAVKYVRRPFEVEAVLVTEDNLPEVAVWCQGDVQTETYRNGDEREFIKVRVARALNERQTKAYPGDWVLYAGTGFKVYTEKAFKKTFEPVNLEEERIEYFSMTDENGEVVENLRT